MSAAQYTHRFAGKPVAGSEYRKLSYGMSGFSVPNPCPQEAKESQGAKPESGVTKPNNPSSPNGPRPVIYMDCETWLRRKEYQEKMKQMGQADREWLDRYLGSDAWEKAQAEFEKELGEQQLKAALVILGFVFIPLGFELAAAELAQIAASKAAASAATASAIKLKLALDWYQQQRSVNPDAFREFQYAASVIRQELQLALNAIKP